MDFAVLDKFWTLIDEKLQTWLEASIKHLPNFVVAICIAIFFGLLAKFVAKGIRKLFHSTLDSPQIANLLTAIIKMVIIFIGLFIALEFLGLSGTVTSLLAGAGIIGLAIGFAFQDMTENFIAGVSMGIRKPFEIGDVVSADGVFGNIRTINLRNTLVETFSGQLEVIPNKILFRNILTNYTTLGKRKIEVKVGISYADDPNQAREVIVKSINEAEYVSDKEKTEVFAESFGDSSINLLVWFWIDYPGEPGFMEARHDAVVRVKKSLEENDILIPFPMRTLDFAAKGGATLSDMMKASSKNDDKNTNGNSATSPTSSSADSLTEDDSQ